MRQADGRIAKSAESENFPQSPLKAHLIYLHCGLFCLVDLAVGRSGRQANKGRQPRWWAKRDAESRVAIGQPSRWVADFVHLRRESCQVRIWGLMDHV